MESPEPINIYSCRVDPRGVVEACREMASEVRVLGPEDDWHELTVLGPARLLRKRLRLRITHNADLYEGPDWESFVAGLSHYIGSFEPVPRQADILRVVASIQFGLAFPDVDLAIVSDDPRVAWVRGICQKLDGFIFTPSMLLDAQGRLLISSAGRSDPLAVLPAVPDDVEPGRTIDGDEDDAEREVLPPDAQRVARRAVVLAAVGNRGLTENERNTHDAPEESRLASLAWIQGCGAAEELESYERKVLQKPVGRLTNQATINAVWRLEGLGVLLWALGLYEIPAYDELVTPGDLFELVGIFDDDKARDFISHARLRPREELDAYRKHATMTHWRFRNFSLRPTAIDFVAFSKDCWIGTFDITRFRISDNDVMVGKKVISKADPQLVNMCGSIANERHLAINWLCGDANLYSQTDTST